MKIKLISKKQYAKLVQIQEEHPLLTYMNKGYDNVDKSKWNEDDHKAFKEASDIISKHIIGFNEFNHFRISKKESKIELRLQYNYNNDDPNTYSFIGVGYLLLDELLNGFKDE